MPVIDFSGSYGIVDADGSVMCDGCIIEGPGRVEAYADIDEESRIIYADDLAHDHVIYVCDACGNKMTP